MRNFRVLFIFLFLSCASSPVQQKLETTCNAYYLVRPVVIEYLPALPEDLKTSVSVIDDGLNTLCTFLTTMHHP